MNEWGLVGQSQVWSSNLESLLFSLTFETNGSGWNHKWTSSVSSTGGRRIEKLASPRRRKRCSLFHQEILFHQKILFHIISKSCGISTNSFLPPLKVFFTRTARPWAAPIFRLMWRRVLKCNVEEYFSDGLRIKVVTYSWICFCTVTSICTDRSSLQCRNNFYSGWRIIFSMGPNQRTGDTLAFSSRYQLFEDEDDPG